MANNVKLKLEDFPGGGYRGSHEGVKERWVNKEVREVPKDTADYLTKTFPKYFAKSSATVGVPDAG